MRRPNRREGVLIALLLGLVALAAIPVPENSGEADAIAQPRVKAEGRPGKERTAPSGQVAMLDELDPAQLQRPASERDPANAFETKSWYVPPPPPPPPPPAKPLPPPAPTAPPLPFTYLGQYQDSDKPIILLVKQDRIYTVKVGEVIEGTYRVEGIAGATLTLTYLPLNIKQTINIGSAG
jgi:hypothetical protein